jgi:cell wall assembly regulator SMI1
MVTDWKQLVRQIQPQAALFEPASETEIAESEQTVGCRFPEDLRSLLSQTNGVSDEWGYGPIRPLAGIVEYTLFMRSIDPNEYRP